MTVSLSTDLNRGRDTHANRPAATAVPAGAYYSCSTHNLVYRSDGSTWSTWATLTPPGGTTGQALVKNSGTDYDVVWGTVSGGGGGSTVKDPRWTPQSGETTIDEFNDASLDVAWTRVDPSGGAGALDWTEGGDVLSAYHKSADSSNNQHGLVRAIGTAPATGDAWVTCVTLNVVAATNYAILGLVISDGTTFGSGKQVFATVLSQSASPQVAGYSQAATNWNETSNSSSTQSTFPLVARIPGRPLYMRLVYKGSSQWRADFSADGVTWQLGASLVTQSSFTPAYVGMYSRDAGSGTPHVASFEFLRRVAGVS